MVSQKSLPNLLLSRLCVIHVYWCPVKRSGLLHCVINDMELKDFILLQTV